MDVGLIVVFGAMLLAFVLWRRGDLDREHATYLALAGVGVNTALGMPGGDGRRIFMFGMAGVMFCLALVDWLRERRAPDEGA